MNPGDLVRAAPVLCDDAFEKCRCWFCATGSPRIGTVLSRHYDELPFPEYDVLFGKEIYTVYENECEVL